MRTSFLTFIAGLLLIAPSKAAEDKIVFTSNRIGAADVFVMSPDGSGQINLTNTPGVVEEFPSWSPDGSKIIFNRSDAIWTMNANGSNPVQNRSGSMPNMAAFQTNSNRISYSRNNGSDYDIFTANANGTGETQITNDPYGDYYARWSPNGTKFTYHTFVTMNGELVPELYFANPDGTGKVRVTTSGNNQNASWSPDGGQIVFQSSRDGNNEIYVMNAYGTTQTRLTNNSFSDTSPVFSPDGSKILFVSNRDGNNEIYVMNANGTGQTRITNNSADDNFPAWQQMLPSNAPIASINDVTVNEGGPGFTSAAFTISLSAPSTIPVSVSYRSYDGTANASSDYSAIPLTTVIFSPGQTSKTVAVPITGDAFDEPNENFSLRIAPVGAKLGKQQGVATILDNDATPSLSVDDLKILEGNTPSKLTNAVVAVKLSATSGQTVTVGFVTVDGEAVSGSDYASKNGTLTFAPGQTSATVTIGIGGDLALEPNERFYIDLSTPVNATLAKPRGTVTITNDDTSAQISVADATAAEGTEATFTITLSSPSNSVVTANYRTVAGTATAGTDYTSREGSISFQPGQTSTYINVPILLDKEVEIKEDFTFVLSNVVGATLSKSTGIGTINDLTAPDISISSVMMREGNSGNRAMYFTASLSQPLPVPVTINYSTRDETALAGSDYVATTGTITIAAGQTSQAITVPVIGDTIVETNETFALTANAYANGYSAIPYGQGIIVNDDVPPSGGTSVKATVSAEHS